VANNYYDKYKKLSDPEQERKEKEGYLMEYESFALSYLQLRKLIGYLGILLPFFCVGSSYFYNNPILPSISHYYHSTARLFFVIILFFLGIFLFSYKGSDKYERAACKTLAIMAFLIALFPTANTICKIKDCYTDNDLNSFIMPAVVDLPWKGKFHLFCAGIFFVLLIYLVYKFLKAEKRHSRFCRIYQNQI
jgi:MFS family permease